MSVKIVLHGDAARFGESVDIEASTVLEAMKGLFERVPDLMTMLLDPGGGHYKAVLELDGKDVRYLQYLDTPLEDGAELHVFPIDFGRSEDRTCYLTFGPERVKNPLLHHAGRMFHVELNILGARITARKGFVHVTIAGPPGEVEAVVGWLQANGVSVDPAE